MSACFSVYPNALEFLAVVLPIDRNQVELRFLIDFLYQEFQVGPQRFFSGSVLGGQKRQNGTLETY